MTLCAVVMNCFCRNPSTKTLPLKVPVPADFKNCFMKCEHQKMKVLMGAVIAGAKQLGVWDGQHGAWDIPRAIRLYESVEHLFEYPRSQTTVRFNDQISWRTVYNLYMKSCPKAKSNGQGHRCRDQGEGDAGIRAVEEANKAEIGEVDETYDTDVEME
jgi:hypothetical protein